MPALPHEIREYQNPAGARNVGGMFALEKRYESDVGAMFALEKWS